MNIKIRLLLFLLFCFNANFLFAQNKLHAKEYHVAINGNDDNDGTINHPFKTIMKAASIALPCDTITVHAGIYREQINPPRGGNSDEERITYRAAKNEKVIIKGSEEIKHWKKIENGLWQAKIPNTFFDNFNPYKEIIHGDWFWPTPKDRIYHLGAVYINGKWLIEAASLNDLEKTSENSKHQLPSFGGAGGGSGFWFATVDDDTTTFVVQFGNLNPNNELVEINVRPTVFYPDKPFMNYITVSGFVMEHAATNWAPPTAEQQGLLGTHWSKGWIIENNKIFYSKCVGIALGKYGDEYDNTSANAATGYIETINRALAFGWNKSTVGSHIVRNNEVAYCEQAGIVGSMGCSFSTIEHNHVHHTYVHRLFNGAEMAAIKLHGAVDVVVKNNCLHNADKGLWLDWMAQGAIVKNNLMFDNDLDIFLEMQHGPLWVYNNLLLSKKNLLMNASGVVFAHNIFAGKMDVKNYDARFTPVLLPHSTYVSFEHDQPSGDVKFYNNLFATGSDVSEYSSALLPVLLDGNVYAKGSVKFSKQFTNKGFGEMNENANEQLKKYKEQFAEETNATDANDFDTEIQLTNDGNKFYFKINFDKNWLKLNRKLITSQLLGKAISSNLPFENIDGTSISIDTDYFGKKRNTANPAPGCFEKYYNNQKILVWETLLR